MNVTVINFLTLKANICVISKYIMKHFLMKDTVLGTALSSTSSLKCYNTQVLFLQDPATNNLHPDLSLIATNYRCNNYHFLWRVNLLHKAIISVKQFPSCLQQYAAGQSDFTFTFSLRKQRYVAA